MKKIIISRKSIKNKKKRDNAEIKRARNEVLDIDAARTEWFTNDSGKQQKRRRDATEEEAKRYVELKALEKELRAKNRASEFVSIAKAKLRKDNPGLKGTRTFSDPETTDVIVEVME